MNYSLTSPCPNEAADLPPVVLLAGPTASGKTALAMALADRYPFELVSVDSAQVFIDMDIGTAKPDRATLACYPHHLINLLPPDAAYSAGQFLTDATRVMHEISARGKIPLLVGGSMLYYKILLEGINDLPQADLALRQSIEEEARQKGWPALHAELAQRDPAAAARIDPYHSHRLQRALELVRLTGRTLDELFAEQKPATQPFNYLPLALFPEDRAQLHTRIAQRFDEMLTMGLCDEVHALRTKYTLTPQLPSMRCVGYRQAWDYLDNQINASQLREQGIAATRQLAKRQLTWLRSLPFSRFDPLMPTLHRQIEQVLQNFLASAACNY